MLKEDEASSASMGNSESYDEWSEVFDSAKNADHFNSSKMPEFKKLIERKKPLIIAICKVKPKNASERNPKDYEIPKFALYPVNLDNDTGLGIAVYTHDSLDKPAIQIVPNVGFEEVCFLKIRPRGGELLPFGCCYSSPTTTATTNANYDELNRFL